ncbi:MAG: putative sulfate exporter family transporter [bacterium]|nr:putative sulfate exporter family transporter [bacterium]
MTVRRPVFEDPELYRWAGSMEGIPEWGDPAETHEERASWSAWQVRGNRLFELTGALMPGLVIASALAFLGGAASKFLGSSIFGLEKSPISPILVAIAAGLTVRNAIGLPAVYEAGLHLCLKRILRIGVALLGIRMSLGAVGAIGLGALPIVIACIASALLLVSWISRAVGLPPRLGTLIAVGTAICGNTAIVATAPAIGADEDETSYAVGTITIFGLLALLTYPFVSHFVFAGDARLAGYFLGTAIHDTAQVAGAGMLYAQQFGEPEALDIATVTKLVRNVFMIAVIPLMAFLYHRSDRSAAMQRPDFKQVVPIFVFGFVGLALFRTLGDLGNAPFGGLLTSEQWSDLIATASTLATWCLTVAMASVGLSTNLKRLRALGVKPLAVGIAAALTVGFVSSGLIHALAPWIGR